MYFHPDRGFDHPHSSDITPRTVYDQRRGLLKAMACGSAGLALSAWAARDALALYGGTLLMDNLYEPWAQAPRGMLLQLFRTTAITAARLFARRQEHAPGMEIARRLILDDPTDEAAPPPSPISIAGPPSTMTWSPGATPRFSI